MATVLAIDAGSTGVRAALFDGRGASIASAYQELAIRFPKAGWVEQDAEAVWAATAAVAAKAIEGAGRQVRIDAVAIANQRASVVAWDGKTLEALSPLISWQDVRARERCRELQAQGLFVTPNLAVTKLEWILRHIPAARSAAARGRLRFGTLDSWLAAKWASGLHVTDHANASATGLYAHLTRGWDEQVLAAIGVDRRWLPEIVDSAGIVGSVTSGAPAAGAPLAAICGDQQASLFGLGCWARGQAKCSYGTAAMVDLNSGGEIAIGGAGTYPLVGWSLAGQATYCIEGSVITAGAAVQWLRDGLGLIEQVADSDRLAREAPEGGEVWAVPAFQGLGTPWVSSESRALIGGLSRASTGADVARAVLEGVAHRVADVAEAVWQGSRAASALRVDGGASRNDFLMQRQADFLGLPVERGAESDGAALGVAALAARVLGEEWDVWRLERAFEPSLSDEERERERKRWRRRVEALALAQLE